MAEPSAGAGISRDEWRWVFLFAILVAAATTLPYLLALGAQGESWRFSGFLFNVDDGNSYIAKMLRGAAGEWLFRTPYTAEPQRGVLAFLFYLLLGKFSSGANRHDQLVLLYHLFRVAASIAMVLSTYSFLAIFLPERSQRRWGLALATLGGGLGWLLVLLGRTHWLGSLPLEFYSPESFGFLSLYGLPHLALARAALLLGLRAFLVPELGPAADRPEGAPALPLLIGLARRESGAGVRAGLYWLVAGLAQPAYVVVIWAVLLASAVALLLWQAAGSRMGPVARSKLWMSYGGRAAWAVLASAPIVIYTAAAFLGDPVLAGWTEQNRIISPHPLHYLLAYGWIAPLAFWGARRLIQRQPWRGWVPVAWAGIFPLLAYAPHNLQRRLVEGVWVALVLLALAALAPATGRRGRAARAYLLLGFPSTLILLAGGILTALRPAPPVFLPAAEAAIFEQLARRVQSHEVALAAFRTGNALPAWAPVRVLIGHGPESVGLAELEPRVGQFFQRETESEERWTLVRDYGVDYVVWGPAERALGDWDPGSWDALAPVARQGDYTIFAVLEP